MTESKGIQSDLIPKIATGLCGGISRTNGTCGAVLGSVMVLNVIYGRNNVLDVEKKDTNYLKVQQFLQNFEREFGSTNCQVLTGCDLSTEQGLEKFETDNMDEQCKKYVEKATNVVMSLLEIPTNE
ncbi:C_GCAxxG_C_C family protein [candidate division KSB1 bacterium]|nr:C_GCAxxG_C_C family protein [candidate division KSB1 bacterium]